MPDKQPKLQDQVRDRIRVKHFSIRTEKAYWGWIKRYIFFNDKRHPKDLGAPWKSGDRPRKSRNDETMRTRLS
jgi:hypothetical protein